VFIAISEYDASYAKESCSQINHRGLLLQSKSFSLLLRKSRPLEDGLYQRIDDKNACKIFFKPFKKFILKKAMIAVHYQNFLERLDNKQLLNHFYEP